MSLSSARLRIRWRACEKSWPPVKSLWTTAQSIPAATAERSHARRVLDHEGVLGGNLTAGGASRYGSVGRHSAEIVLADQDDVHEGRDPPVAVDELEVRPTCGGHDGHPDVSGQVGEGFENARDLDL